MVREKKKKLGERGVFIIFLVIGQSNGPLQKKNPSKHAPTIN